MSAAKEKFLELLYHVDEWGLLEKEERSFLLQPLKAVVGCNDDWAKDLCYPLPDADKVTGIALNVDFFHDLYGDAFNADQLSSFERSNLVRFQVAYGGLLAKLRWRWGECAMRYSDCFQDCDTDIALEIFSFGIMSKMVESEYEDNLFVGLCRKWFSLSLFNFSSASYDNNIYIVENHCRKSQMYRLYRCYYDCGIKPLSDPEKSINRLPENIRNGVLALRAVRDIQKQYPTLQRFLAGTDILKSIDVYQMNQSFFRNATIQKLEEENQELRDIIFTRRPDTADSHEKYLENIYPRFFPVISLGNAAKVLSVEAPKFTYNVKGKEITKECVFSRDALKKYFQRKAKAKENIKVKNTTYYSVDVLVDILKNYMTIDEDCRKHWEFRSKFRSTLAKQALTQEKFEEKYKKSEVELMNC